MCGIAGIFNFNCRADVQLPHIFRMAQAMKHRGPDDEGFVLFQDEREPLCFFGDDTPREVRQAHPNLQPIQGAGAPTSVTALGHRRLSILDLSPGGHQPMRSSDGRYWIVYNGEIYNYIELREELESNGYVFRTASDTEVILAAFTEWKDACLERFNGDFAFAIWDVELKCIFCARDRIGIKPFYYLLNSDSFIFASDIKTLIESGKYRPKPDPEGLYLSMAFGIAPRPITAFKGIFALEQAHWIRVNSNGRFQKKCYWKIPVGTQEHLMSEGDALELLEEQLERAIKRRLVADVPVGTFMSGGIDSTTVSAIAARMHAGIKAFTIGYKDNVPVMDEVSQAVATARMHPIDHIVHYVDANDSIRDIDRWVEGYEEPYYSGSSTFELSRVVKMNNVKVILNGLGGDELFSGYSYYKYHDFRPNSILRNFALIIPDSLSKVRFLRILNLYRARTHDELHTILSMQASDNELSDLFNLDFRPTINTPSLLHNLYANDVVFSDGNEAISYMDLMNYIGNHQVHRIDQFTMAFSIEGRFPFLDHEMIEAAFKIPSRFKFRKGEQKYLLRRLAKKYIAPECLSMKKKGFGLPIELWMAGPLESFVNNSLASLQERNEVNALTVKKWAQKYRDRRLGAHRIWHLVNLELWFRRFID